MSKRFVYILALELGKYYIGLTKDVDRRMRQHESGEGVEWTKLYRPKELIRYSPGNEQKEAATTLVYMRKYGWNNVRGGPWNEINMGAPHVFKFTPEEAKQYAHSPIPAKFG